MAGSASIRAGVEGAANFSIEVTGLNFDTNGVAPSANSTMTATSKNITVGQSANLTVKLVDGHAMC